MADVEDGQALARNLGAKLRGAARDNLLGDPTRAYKAPGEDRRPVSAAQVNAGLEQLAKMLQPALDEADDGYSTLEQPFRRVEARGKAFWVVSILKEEEEDEFGFNGDAGSGEPQDSPPPRHHSAVDCATGDLWGINEAEEPIWAEGVRANVTEPASLEACLNPKTGMLTLVGFTVPVLVWSIGVPVDAENAFGETALMQAARCGHLAMVTWLIEEGGADPSRTTRAEVTALMLAAEQGSENHEPIVRMLASHPQGRLNHQNAWGATALHVVAFRGNLSMCRILLECGARSDLKDGDGKVPADYTHETTSYVSPSGAEHYSPEVEALLAN